MSAAPSKFLLYSLAILSSLSTAAATMTLLGLSTVFFSETEDGILSSSIASANYLGVACMGLFGGGIIQRYSNVSIGILGPLISALIVFALAITGTKVTFIALTAIFIIFFINGIDHPNNLRYYNENLEEKDKMSFFSLTEGVNAFFAIMAPVIASYLIIKFGVRFCFIIDGLTYILSCIPWIFVRQSVVKREKKKIDWFLGFKTILINEHVRSLTLNRILNNCAFVSCVTIAPVIIAKGASGELDLFTSRQGFLSSLISLGFIGASLIGSKLTRNPKRITILVFGASVIGYVSYFFIVMGLIWVNSIFFGAFLLGIATFCFRISGMTLGQAFTPVSELGPVIIAGDAIVRLWSFLVSLLLIVFIEFIEQSIDNLSIRLMFTLILPSIALLAPFWSLHLAKQFANRNHAVST